MKSLLNQINKNTFPIDISSAPQLPTQPNTTSISFHALKDGKKRKFNFDWYLMYSWLEYSVKRNLIYCFACRHFPTDGIQGSNSKLFQGKVLETGNMLPEKVVLYNAMKLL